MPIILPVIEIVCFNGSKNTRDIDPSDIREVSIDRGRPLDIRVRVDFKSATAPLDLSFHKPNAPVTIGHPGPLVSEVTVFTDAGPVSLADPDMVYGTMSNWMRLARVTSAPVETGGTEAPQE